MTILDRIVEKKITEVAQRESNDSCAVSGETTDYTANS